MSDNATYQVVGECAHVTTDTQYGRAKLLVYKGALVPADAPELRHLLDSGLVARVGGDASPGVNADGEPGPADPVVDEPADESGADMGPAVTEDDEVAARREAARAKLPTDGSAPDGRASKDTIVEYLVANGGRYEDLVTQDKATLQELVKARS